MSLKERNGVNFSKYCLEDDNGVGEDPVSHILNKLKEDNAGRIEYGGISWVGTVNEIRNGEFDLEALIKVKATGCLTISDNGRPNIILLERGVVIHRIPEQRDPRQMMFDI